MMKRFWSFSLILLFKTVYSQMNIASNGTASQSSNYHHYYANLAISGSPTHDWKRGSCSTTAERKQVAWWMLTFSLETVFVSNVIIYYRSNTPSRLAGYSLYITNSSISSSTASPPSDGHLCYHHDEDSLPNILQNITCNQLGKRVLIYNERKTGVTYPHTYSKYALLELCDMQIIGCYKSWWGVGCRKPCPAFCTEHHCHPSNGSCIWGCSPNNCLNNDRYNNGTCAAGCKKGHGGLFCIKENAANGTVLLTSDTHNQQASLVTDGDKRETSCVTLSGTDSRLEIDIGDLHVIQTINIVLKNEFISQGYLVYASNTTGDRTKELNVINFVTHTFPFHVHEYKFNPVIVGRYVIISNIQASVAICEVEVLGCPFGLFGDSCDMKCSLNCNGPCHPENGNCVFGCTDGYIGYTCSEACTPPHFGRYCNETCHCMKPPCNFIDGTCPKGGCEAGWDGHSCSKACTHPRFGLQCQETCHCMNPSCNFVNGTCPFGGCEAGWDGHSCTKECGFGRFGKNCEQSCEGCLLTECDAATGKCKNLTGCRPGWKNGHTMCNEECDDRYFGDCSTQCYCRDGICNKSTGRCPSNECESGWQGETCSQECGLGWFGIRCQESCNGCLMSECEAVNGECKNQTGCRPGWKNEYPMCNIECEDRYFGDCSTECNCRDGICNKMTGVCPGHECDEGWMGKTCSQECIHGTFGYNCAKTCDRCVNSTCDIYNGNCTFGCLPGYDGNQCQILVEKHRRQKQQVSSLVGLIGGSVGGTLAVIIIAIIIFVIIRSSKSSLKERYKGNQTYSTRKDSTKIRSENSSVIQLPLTGNHDESASAEINSVYINQEAEFFEGSFDDGADIYSNMDSHNYSVDELRNIIQEKWETDGYKKDFENLPKGLLRPHEEGSKEENKIKNRFLMTWPYDHSRVILNGNDTSDYINASYIDSYAKTNAYIATQGPKQNTVNDFWQMVWQENVRIIVMVANVEENGKKKCYPYWPNRSTHSVSTGDYKLSFLHQTETAVYSYTKIHMYSKNDKKDRDVHHFHFLQWEDHGVPDTIKLMNFYWKIKRINPASEGPMVVHCSAGIGRTGTFIAIDALYENGLKTGFIDVLEYVQIMRKDRMNMIQTKDQYATVYEALLEAFTVPDSSVNKDEFCSGFDNDNSDKIPKIQRKMSVEYKKLQDIKPCYTNDDYKAANIDDNASKNVNQQILAHDKYRPYLMSYGKSRTDYINAVVIPSHVRQRNVIVTQYPLKSTVVDFWTLIYDTDCTMIVILETMNDMAMLFPDEGKSLKIDILEVLKVRCASPFVNFRIEHKQNDESKQVKVLFVEDWPIENMIPPSEKYILDIQALISAESFPNSMAVVCRDGCTRSGMFVALYLTLQKLELENEVDLFNVVRMMRIRRPEFISHPEEYEYCYKCIRQHLEMESVYANFQ